jgi:hypothetical protein
VKIRGIFVPTIENMVDVFYLFAAREKKRPVLLGESFCKF